MLKSVGPVRQLGVVVHDADAAMRYYAETLGVGPFLVNRRIVFEDFVYRGRPSPSPVVTLAFAQSGDLQVEIVQQHDEAPSGYRDFLGSGREGPQHVAAWFAERPAYDAAHAALLGRGLQLVHSGKAVGVDCRFAYFSGGEGLYPEFEIAEALVPEVAGFAELVARQAAGWDGRHPVRGMDGSPET